MDPTPAKDPISEVRSDLDIFKIQVEICAWCGVVVGFLLICALIYAFILIRKVRIEFDEKLRNFNPPFNINRPKLLSPNHPLTKLRNEVETSSSASREAQRSKSQPMLPSTGNGFIRQNLNSPTLSNNGSSFANQNPYSPGLGANKNDNNYRRANDSFLNKNRGMYSPSRGGDVTPQTPSTPAYVNTPVRNGHFFS